MNERSVLGIVVYQNSKQVQVHACALAWAGGGGGGGEGGGYRSAK